ncbi:hypothetical protein GCM10022221_80030 [Actinocorallia aurea]
MRRAVIACTAVMGALFLFLGLGMASASAASGEALLGTLKKNGSEPVAGVKISVASEAGAAVGETTSDAEGKWKVPLEGAGTYKVTLDTATLPSGVELKLKDRATLTVSVQAGRERTVLFILQTAASAAADQKAADENGTFTKVAQLTFDGFNYGVIIALAALGVSLIFGTTGLTNFAHGELVTLGAFLALVLNVSGLPLWLAAIGSVFLCGVFGYVQDRWLWGKLRKRGISLVVTMIITIGFSMFLRHLYLFIWGGENQAYRDYTGQGGWSIGPINATPKSLVGIGIALVVLVAVGLALTYTRFGKATRAVADNPALAASSGINVEQVIRIVWTLGTAIAGLAGVIFALSYGLNYRMGFSILLLIFAGVTLGGLGTAFGAMVGSLVVGIFLQLSTLIIPVEFKYAGALAILILVLMFRPQGILGRAERIG